MVKIIFNVWGLLTITLAIAISQPVYALTIVTASIDANPVFISDSIVLTVVADDSLDRDALDTSALLNDFIIARTEVSTQTKIINLSMSRITQWQIVIIPKKLGSLTIPSLTILGHSSQAIKVQVNKQGEADSASQQNVFITTALSSSEVYVQQLVTLTIKLHIGVPLQRGSLTEPSLPGAIIEQIGKDQESEGLVNGKRYRIIERTYAITPEQSGDLTLDTPMFSGDVMVQSRGRSNFLSFGGSKPINLFGEKLQLNVLPIPESFTKNTDAHSRWLPSELLTLEQEWQPNLNEFHVGEPITRTITLNAAGLGKAQLPQINMPAPAGLKIYPDQAELGANLTKERLISQKKQNFAIVASRSGEYTLPPITIAWWNTRTNVFEEAILPAQTITVKMNPDAPQPIAKTSLQAPIMQVTDPSNLTLPQSTKVEQTKTLQWLFLTLWLLTTIAWLFHVNYLKRLGVKKVPPTRVKANPTKIKKANHHYLALMAACKQHNGEQALILILPWLNSLALKQNHHKSSTLSDAIVQIDHALFTDAFNELQQFLYANKETTQVWCGSDLLKAIQQINNSGTQNKNKTKFTLNPY